MIAVSISEFNTGVAAVAAPVLGVQGQLIGSMAVAGPVERFTPDRVEQYIRMVKAACQKLSKEFGY
ncbi:MAG: IclR family transcriptional regulator C-terminal domain-containing protein, partial [Oscillospiraceae bacterium]